MKNGDTRTGFLPPPLYLSDFLAPIFEGKKKATVEQSPFSWIIPTVFLKWLKETLLTGSARTSLRSFHLYMCFPTFSCNMSPDRNGSSILHRKKVKRDSIKGKVFEGSGGGLEG
ncbi:hypothetical protein, partial [Bilophila wadsworthia]|uniref:hypothetical protein n=1 Tax=Bilophila wadsworthia TaxID=35833 RepID=UPI0032606CF3